MTLRILITGASVAGATAAWWLSRHGFDVNVVERAGEFRDGGQNIDVRGMGRDVLRLMGLEQAALAQGTGERGTAWVDASGGVVAQFLVSDSEFDGPTAEMEILRGDLARLLYVQTRDRAVFRFGDSIESICQDDKKSKVTFVSGVVEEYDVVIVAEGVGSTTRELVFPNQNAPRWMGLTMAYFTIPRTASDNQLWRWYQAAKGRSVSLRPDTHGTTRAMLALHKSPSGEQSWDIARQKALMRERFTDAGWETPRVLAGMAETDDFYFDVLRQVCLNNWSNGRIVLTGDAAWCVTPIAGMGTTLAIVGAYVLAGELSRTQDIPSALAAYEKAMRPMVAKAQAVPNIGPRIMNPHTHVGVRLLHGMLRFASKPAVRRIAAKMFSRERDKPKLPRYDTISYDNID